MAKYAIARTDGGVSIMETVGKATPEECIAKWPTEDQDAVVSVTPIDNNAIPSVRTFRDAWKVNGKSVDHDMAKARDIQMARIRHERDMVLVAKDTEAIIAIGRGDQAAAARVETEKQKLRDLPQAVQADVDAARTPDELKAVWPRELG